MCHDPYSAPPLGRDRAAGVVADQLILTAADGARFRAFAARPETPSGAAVVVLPDVRGLTGFYGELAVQLAEHGHAAVAIDYYGRTAGLADRAEDFPFMQHVRRLSRPTIQADVAAAVAHLRSPAGGAGRRIFTLGFCLGARTAWLSATTANQLAGAIGFYGALGVVGPYRDPGPTQLADTLRAPILALMGGADEGIPPSEVHAFDTALTTAGVEHEIVVYPGAPHGFFDVRHAEFADACADAWQRTIAFIARRSHDIADLDGPAGSAAETTTSPTARGEDEG
jgi:carboxymethylenebutenolidase